MNCLLYRQLPANNKGSNAKSSALLKKQMPEARTLKMLNHETVQMPKYRCPSGTNR